MMQNKMSGLTLRNNPCRFKLEREPTSLIHCFAMAMEKTDENFPMLVIERRALDSVLFGKRLDSTSEYRQYPFVMRGGQWDKHCKFALLSYFIICWRLRKLDPSQFPIAAFLTAYESYIERCLILK